MIVCIPVSPDGSVDPRWGRAQRVAIAEVDGVSVTSWREFDVGWGSLHDAGPETSMASAPGRSWRLSGHDGWRSRRCASARP